MRKVFVLCILFAMSFFLKELGLPSHESVLVAIGFVLLAAYTLSEIGSGLTLPRVTGYILAGLALGPYAFQILTKDIVGEIRIFNTLAIGLIAITAGLEIHFASLKKVIAAILTTTALKVLSLAVLVIGTFYTIESSLNLLQLPSTVHILAIAAVFAALCIGTSPAISLAVITETKAKGRMSQLVLGSAVVKDVVMVVALALALSLARSLTGDGGHSTESFSHLMIELAYSILAGCLLGGAFILIVKYIRQEMFVLIFAILTMILLTAEVSEAIHLELLLVFIVTGIVIRNFSHAEEVLHEALSKISLPVFVVFFTNVGAGLDLKATYAFLPLAAGLFAARALAFLFSGWMAGRLLNEKPYIQRNVWLGYLPQAGVTLGLIAIATEDLPAYKEVIENIGMGLVTINLLLGPVTLRMALRSGEETDESETVEEVKPVAPELQKSEPRTVDEDDEFENLVNELRDKIFDDKLKEEFAKISFGVFSVLKKQQIAPQKGILTAFTNDLNTIYDLTESQIVDKLDDHFSRMGEKGRDIYNASSIYLKAIDACPVAVNVRLHSFAIKRIKGDGFILSLRKAIRRPSYWFDKKPQRIVPFRKLAKYNLEPFIGTLTMDLIHSWYRLLGLHIDTFQRKLELHSFEERDIVEKIQQENILWFDNIISDFYASYRKAALRWIDQLNRVNTVYLADNKIRYSHVEPEIKEAFEASKKASVDWQEKFVFCRNRLKVVVQSALLGNAVNKLLDEKFFIPVEDAQVNADQLVQDVFNFFSEIENALADSNRLQRDYFKTLLDRTTDFNRNHLQADIKTKYIRGSFRLLNRDISINLKKNLPREEGSFQITSEQTPPHLVKTPAEIMVKKINLYELYEQSILINFLPVIEEKIEGISNYLESLLQEMEQAFSILTYSFESQSQSDTEFAEKEMIDSIRATLSTEREKISELYNGLSEYVSAAKESAGKLIEESQQEVNEGIERFSVVTTARNQFRQTIHRVVEQINEKQQQIILQLKNIYRKLKSSSRYFQEREIDRTIQSKVASKTLDTTTIKQFIDESYSVNYDFKNLPRVYYRLFSMDPILDRRFFVAHLGIWRHLEPLAKSLKNREGLKILVLGARGMGKSSLLNVAQMDVRTERLVRIDEIPQKSPMLVLAQNLGCQKGFQSILATLKRQSTTIIIDNFDQWARRDNMDDFNEFLEIIKQSSHHCHWLLSMTKCNFDFFDKAFKVKSIFNKIIDLSLTDHNTAREVILSRHRLSGLTIDYPQNLIGEWASKLGISDSDELFFRVIFERSHGHLRHLIFLWLLSLSEADGKHVRLAIDKGIDRGLPFINELSLIQRYILAQLYRFHRLTVQDLAQALGVSPTLIDNEAQYLQYSGLIVYRGIDRNLMELPTHLTYLIGNELNKEGLVNEWYRD